MGNVFDPIDIIVLNWTVRFMLCKCGLSEMNRTLQLTKIFIVCFEFQWFCTNQLFQLFELSKKNVDQF